ncbi:MULTISPECIES: hypothetical protein [unclassified Mesorhizobium]|uniref:hypothetical protein n=1 Tax=unclassified Mesorhizobium TaxID=325217 RepID=UPI000F75D4CD|nr:MULTISPECIES: hypothetical protein [unclassified Mesorhizobium]AZO72913.1 hypothetical protein EJ067_18310 [Mesorhizobium sp. M1D.F.Ca.ET.043.01.1.1]RWA90792.1 MAG: hypothetical protein EOQ32_18110 [Mesorhizobium sp.]RWD61611.1 MAG: hypothetical protein EOS36_17410 [Mesorhizobium sp.]RWE44550.1 MAG: hypothetical protein EOS79_14145 [Mesorhizobium sp.]TIV92093.1 MAG: hypothetical protein E5V85_29535 [Mesorhizobium sp.]
MLIGLTLVGPVAAEEAKCPKGEAPIQTEDIEAAPGCIQAHKLHEACAWGSSGDANMTEIVVRKCEAGFFDRMTAAQKRRYEARGQACGKRYPITELGGSIQIYLSAMCFEDLAATYFKAAKGGRIVGTPRWKVPDIAE